MKVSTSPKQSTKTPRPRVYADPVVPGVTSKQALAKRRMNEEAAHRRKVDEVRRKAELKAARKVSSVRKVQSHIISHASLDRLTPIELKSFSEMDRETLADWVSANPGQAQLLIENYYALRIETARNSPDEFIEFVGRDEETGKPLVQAPVHREFQRLATQHRRLVLWAHVEAAKTTQLSILRALWELGRNPRMRIAVVSRTIGLARKIVKAVQNYIEHSAELKAVFPHLAPGKKWTETAFDVATADGEFSSKKEYSFQAFGYGSTVQGARLDLVILDDVLDWANTRTPEQRAQVSEWWRKNFGGRLTMSSRVIAIGNAWHPLDLLHEFAANDKVWHSARFPVMNVETGELNWAERWPIARIEEYRTEHPLDFARSLLCVARSDEDARFKKEWIDACLARGDGIAPIFNLTGTPPGVKLVTGVDLGTRANRKSDLTVLFTIALYPNEDVEVLNAESGRWTGPDIVRRIKETHERYHSTVYVEDNAAQDYLRQFIVKDSGIPVLPFNTGKNKIHPDYGVESLAVELHNAKWIIPSKGGIPATKTISAWISGLLNYSPDAHTADEVMASWIARQGSRQKKAKAKSLTADVMSR